MTLCTNAHDTAISTVNSTPWRSLKITG